MPNNVNVNINAKDNLSAPTKRMANNFTKSMDGVKESSKSTAAGLATLAKGFIGLVAVKSATRWISNATKAYNVQAKAEAKLRTALGFTSKAILEQASALQKLTLFGDEETISAAGTLAKYQLQEEQIQRLLPLVQDFATVQGMSLVAAADMVGKSVGSSTNALTRYGIEITGVKGSSERAASAVAGLTKQVKGQAEEAAEAGTGGLQQLGMAYDDMTEKIGKGFIPATNKSKTAIIEMINAVGSAGRFVVDVIAGSVDYVFAGVAQLYMTVTSLMGKFIQSIEVWVRLIPKMGGVADGLKSARTELEKISKAAAETSFDNMTASAVRFQAAIGKGSNDTASRATTTSGTTTGGATGGSGDDSDAIQRAKTLAQTIFDIGQQYRQLGMDARAKELDDIGQWYKSKLEIVKGNDEAEAELLAIKTAREKAVNDAADKRAETSDRREKERKKRAEKFLVSSTLDSLKKMTKGKKEYMAVYKAASIAQAIMDTYASANAAYLAGLSIGGPQGLILGGIAMAASIVAGITNVSQIASAKFAKGGDFVTSGRQLIEVGDNPGGRERLQITPLSSPNINGPKESQISFVMPLTINGNATPETVGMLQESQQEQMEWFKSTYNELQLHGEL